MGIKIQIKSISGDILFEYEKDNNTIKDTLEKAIKGGIDLSHANLRYANLSHADLYNSDLSRANLSGANLCYSILNDADLCGANLCDADLSHADLRYANLFNANFSNANLSCADLCYANLSCADFRDVDLRDADLRYAHLYDADLRNAKNIPFIPLSCPSEGAFVGWKIVEGKLVKLEIPEDAKRSSATTNKCRCEKAKVLSITDLEGKNPIDEILNTSQKHKVLYKVGEMVYPDWFDEDRWNECSHGIHFFINKQEAINY